MSICLCYHDEPNFLHERGVCYGTKEKEPCSCGGDPAMCDFYEEVREKYIHRTNYDRIVSKTPEELAAWIDEHEAAAWCPDDPPVDPETKQCLLHDGDCRLCVLDWLKQEAE